MPFQNQFSLSLELTRLLPLGTYADKATQAIVNFGRQLKNSGSDIITEDDLLLVFGRSKISATLESSFKMLVAESSSNRPLFEGIILQAGPGPTVGRALRERPYFAMVIQLSLLSWSYDAGSLAIALADTLQKRAEGATSVSSIPSCPSSDAIHGVLEACLRQTSTFNWNMLLHAVAHKLGHALGVPRAPLPLVILQGAVDMFPSIQSLPQDRIVHIRLPQDEFTENWGTCPIVVWTHHILELIVIVRRKTETVRFGDGTIAQVVVEELPPRVEPGITLLDALGDELLDIRPEPNTASMGIESIARVRAQGYGNYMLFESLSGMPSCIKAEDKAVVGELQAIVCAISQLISSHLYHDDASRFDIKDRESAEFRDCTSDIRADIDHDKILKASMFLFANPDLSQRKVDNYMSSYTHHALNGRELRVPGAFRALCKMRDIDDGDTAESWDMICVQFVPLSILNIAFAHVLYLEDCTSLMLKENPVSLLTSDLCSQLRIWDGRRNLYVRAEAWLQVITAGIMGSRTIVDSLRWESICLVSDGGWSAWMPIFGSEDPASMKPGFVLIYHGTPCRKGVWKSFVSDLKGDLETYGCQKVEGVGQQASLRCIREVSFANPFCGELQHHFLVSACISQYDSMGRKRSYRIGFRELQNSLWCTSLAKRCRHGLRKDPVEIPMNCATLAGFEHRVVDFDEERFVCLTAESISARWLALVTFDQAVSFIQGRKYDLLLRDSNCCFQCALDELTLKPKPSILIL